VRYRGIHRSCLSHPAIKGPPRAIVPVGSIGASVQSIADNQNMTNSADPESPKKRGCPVKPVPMPSTTSGSRSLSRGRPQKAPTEAPKKDDLLGDMILAVRGMDVRIARQVGQSRRRPTKRSQKGARLCAGSLMIQRNIYRRSCWESAPRYTKGFTLAKPSSNKKILISSFLEGPCDSGSARYESREGFPFVPTCGAFTSSPNQRDSGPTIQGKLPISSTGLSKTRFYGR
jgi:hypothetical protein